MQGLLRSRLTNVHLLKRTTKSGGLPHYDPPDFKKIKNKRYFLLEDHFLWLSDHFTQEYHVTLKQNFLKGPWGAVAHIIKYFIIGIIVPTFIYTKLKSIAHDSKGYYKAYLTAQPGSPIYHDGNFVKQLQNCREIYYKNSNPDVLGRNSADYYRIKAPCYTKPSEPSKYEVEYSSVFIKNTTYGRGAA